MLGPTMLRVVGQQYCVRLHGPLVAKAWRISSASEYVFSVNSEQFRIQVSNFSLFLKLYGKSFDVTFVAI